MFVLAIFIMICLALVDTVSANQLFTSCVDRKSDETDILHSVTSYSFVECAAICMGETECRSASFQRYKNKCVLFAANYSDVVCESLEADVGSQFLSKKDNPCKNNQPFNGIICLCESPLSGQFCANGPRDCTSNGTTEWVDIYPDDGLGSIRVWCYGIYMLIAAAPITGWTTPYLNKTWDDYKYTFGDVTATGYTLGGFWLGNENVHRIINTDERKYKMKYMFKIPSDVDGFYLDVFVDTQANNYALYYGSYQTSTGADQVIVNGSMFRTIDHNDNGCAAKHGYGFWYNGSCPGAHTFNGIAFQNGQEKGFNDLWIELIRI